MMNISITNAEVWRSTLLFGVLGIVLLILVTLLTPKFTYVKTWIPVVMASAGFWGAASLVGAIFFWEFYYRFIFPDWSRILIPANLLLYGAIGYILWYIATRLPFHPALSFALLGGLEGIAEHLFGIYALRLLQKVPWLSEVNPGPVLVFSFFEYVLYWTIVIWIAIFLSWMWFRPQSG